MNKSVKIIWKKTSVKGSIEIKNQGKCALSEFDINNGILTVTVEDAMLSKGAFATVVTVRTDEPFSFFLRDVRSDMPIYIPEYQVIVTESEDGRDYDTITADIARAGRRSKIQLYETTEEECFDKAAARTRNMPCPIWLGISRDVRMFEARINTLSEPSWAWDTIQPVYHHLPLKIEETGEEALRYDYFAGRGIGCRHDIKRRLEQGVLPILNYDSIDDEITYRQKLFVTLEKSALKAENVKGTHYQVSDKYGVGESKQTPEQKELEEKLHDGEIFRDEETVIYLRITAENTSQAPKYAYMRIPQPNVSNIPSWNRIDIFIDNGMCCFSSSGRCYMSGMLDGKAIKDYEYAILLGPGEKCEFDFRIPHMPVSKERAEAFAQFDFDEKLAECTDYWNKKLDKIAKIKLPEKRIEEMMKAGFLHLDLVAFGNEPDGTVAPCVGVYTPIGTESTPIIQYIESVGDTELATRCVDYFLDKQHDDGFIQNFDTYMSETGLALWNAGEHYKYTKDRAWLDKYKDRMIKGCDFIAAWSERNKDEGIRHHGYGMIDGKVADPELPFRSYMLNSTSYAGVRSCAEALEDIGDPNATRIRAFADEYKANILDSAAESLAQSPVVPLSDGSWCPAYAQWPMQTGPNYLFADGGTRYTHGTMVELSDTGCYDICYDVISSDSVFADFIIKSVTETVTQDNTGFSQPYYSMHPMVHVLRGEVGSFLKEFYSNMSALADRETYSFWEHYFQVSPHKTHEEGWFLMRCRWMLYMDQKKGELNLLPAVPRDWLKDGGSIELEGMKSRFGTISLKVCPDLAHGKVDVQFALEPVPSVTPSKITLRIPHPERRKAVKVSCGQYDAQTETITLAGDTQKADMTVYF